MQAKELLREVAISSGTALFTLPSGLLRLDVSFHCGLHHSTLTDDRATGETYCLPHDVTVDGERRRLVVASLRYLDTFAKMDGSWLFAERRLYVDWLEERTLS